MKRLTLVVLVLAVFALSVSAFAQQTKEEMVTVPKSQLTEQQLQAVKSQELKEKIGQYGEWVGLGKEIGVAVDSSLGALTNQADKFSRTGVGKFTMFLVAWKVLGNDLIQFLIGVPLLVAGLAVWIWSFRKNCIPFKYLAREDDGSKTYEMTRPDCEQQVGHVVVFVVFIVICMLVIFAG